jgi:hypothetical protein
MIDTITTHQSSPTRHHNASASTDKFFTTSSRLLKNKNSRDLKGSHRKRLVFDDDDFGVNFEGSGGG